MRKRVMPDEYQLILASTRLEINDAARQGIRKLLSGLINWNKVIEISSCQETLPFLYYALNRLNLSGIVPADIFAKIKNYYYANLNKNLRFEKEISLILESVNHDGISIIPFKGFSLIQTLYHNPGLRIMVDLDILVKQNQFQRIKNILTQLGYQENFEEAPAGRPCGQQQISVFSKIASPHLSWFIEIHDTLAPARPYKINLPYLWERAQEITLNGQKLLCLSGEDTFLSLTLHLRRHTRRLTLKFIVDIAELLNINKDSLDWGYIKESAKNNRILMPVYLALYLAEELLGVTVSPKILNEFRPYIIKSALMHFTINKYNFFALKKWQGICLRLLLFDSPLDFLLYLWRVSFLERFIARVFLKKTEDNIAKRAPRDSKEKIKK